VFTLAQLREDVAPLVAHADLREFVLRVLADRKDDASAPVAAFVTALGDQDPRVRLIAAWGVGRLGAAAAADALVQRLADADPLVAHVAVNSLVALRAYDACAKALDSSTPNLVPGAARALQAMHETRVVELLTQKLSTQQDPAVRSAVYRALCRLAYREADWDGGWWGTRPDTSGPYYKLAEWEGTAKVKDVLRAGLSSEKPAMLRTLVVELKRHKVDLPEAAPVVAKLAATDPTFRQVLVDLLASKNDLSADDVALVRPIALAADEPEALRAKAVRLLARKATDDAALDAVVEAIAPVGDSAGALASAFTDITRDPRLGRRAAYFVKLADSAPAPRRDLAYAVLLNLANSTGERGTARATARKALDAAWSDAASAASLLRAIARTRAPGFGDKVTALQSDPRPEVAAAASTAAQQLGLSAAPAGPTIATVGYDKTVAVALSTKGDASKGSELFARLACVNCHTTSPEQPPKGPFLGGISTRYSRAELCESILKPSAKISQGFETQWFKPASGDVIEGFVSRESGDEVELRNVQGETIVLKKPSIQRRGKRDFSTMPEGLVANLTPGQFADLLAYLESLKGKQL
jgi:putative heme-binding domain-containing protein